jgi:putative transcriptional regulator
LSSDAAYVAGTARGAVLSIEARRMESLRGRLLISSGGLYDPNFRHTVVLIGEHTADGALGVVLNRALNVTVQEALPALSGMVPPGELLFQGGPVEPASPVLIAEFASPDLADIPVFGSVGFLVGEISGLEPGVLRARVFAGYSGWGPGQLEAEMAVDSWIIEPAREHDVFTDAPDLLWSGVLQRKGPEYRRLSRMPYDPSMN